MISDAFRQWTSDKYMNNPEKELVIDLQDEFSIKTVYLSTFIGPGD